MARRDYYKVLGVARNASLVEIKRAFRELARRHHPDVSREANAAAKFREIGEAFAVLSDSKRRAQYDRFGHLADSAPVGFAAGAQAVEEVLGDMFRGRRDKARGQDFRYTLELTLVEAAFGTTKEVTFVPPGETLARAFAVVIPAGTKDGVSVRVAAEGGRGRGRGDAGDLHVMVRVVEHAALRRVEDDVWSEMKLSFPQAALGAIVEVDTIDGPVKMRVPEGTVSGRTFRIRGRGVPRSGAKGALRGDHLVKVEIAVPEVLTERQRELIEALARELGERGPAQASGSILRRGVRKVRSILGD